MWKTYPMLAAALLAAAGCSSAVELGGACKATKDCKSGECVLGSCTACTVGEKACNCRPDSTCDSGLSCQAGVCNPTPCEAGAVGCPCKAGEVCNSPAVCKAGTCAPCTNDVAGCPCAAGACQGGLVCETVSALCRAAKTCAQTTCLPNQKCGEGAAGKDAACLPECLPGFTWNAGAGACEAVAAANCEEGKPLSILAECQALHRACSPATATAGAKCGDCEATFTDEQGKLQTCRELVSCAQASCAAEHRACTERTASADAACGACLEGYLLQGQDCREIPAGSCDPAAPNSTVPACAAAHRICVEPVTGKAYCGDCATGYVTSGADCKLAGSCEAMGCAALNRSCEVGVRCTECLPGMVPVDPTSATGACRPRRTCEPSPCTASQFCVEHPDADSTCSDTACPAGSAKRLDTNACVSCMGITCGATGQTGRLWPFTLEKSNRCVCETLAGYYDEGNGAPSPSPCDADGDGWVRATARLAVDSTDPTLRSNARCEVRLVDRVVLVNEYRQEFPVDLQAKGFATRPVALYEPVRNDSEADLATLPPYGRLLKASELNAFTKACVSTLGDFNGNLQADVDESQGTGIFDAFSYFLELHTGRYVAPAAGEAFGHYRIEERSRCNALPLRYEPGADPYWQSCARKRDSTWDPTPSAPRVGQDFAQWSPPGAPPPLAAATPSVIPPHGLCDSNPVLPPADQVWRGMNHHSQFKCVVVTSVAPTTPAGIQSRRQRNGLWPNTGSTEVLNRCTAGASTSPGAAPNPSDPVLTCAPLDANSATLKDDDVGFAAYRWTTGGVRGCIFEGSEPGYIGLCPGYTGASGIIVSRSNINAFGALMCGCSDLLGGADCEVGCAGSDKFDNVGTIVTAPADGGTPDTGPSKAVRLGYWLCARPVASVPTPLGSGVDGGYRLVGRIPARIVTLQPQTSGADGGYVVR